MAVVSTGSAKDAISWNTENQQICRGIVLGYAFLKSDHFWYPCLISISFQQIFNEHILYGGGMYIQVL